MSYFNIIAQSSEALPEDRLTHRSLPLRSCVTRLRSSKTGLDRWYIGCVSLFFVYTGVNFELDSKDYSRKPLDTKKFDSEKAVRFRLLT